MRTFVFLLAVLLVTGIVSGEILVLRSGGSNSLYPEGYSGVEDVTLRQAKPACNYAKDWTLLVGSDSDGSQIVSLMRWDLSKLSDVFNESENTVLGVQLVLSNWYVKDAPQQEFGLFEITPQNAGWVEGNGGSKGTPANDSPTWSHKRYPTEKWSGSGDLAGASQAEAFAVIKSDKDTQTQSPRKLPSVHIPVDIARKWALQPEKNAGFVIKPITPSKGASVFFVSSEHPRKDSREWDKHGPSLIISYVSKKKRASVPAQPGQLATDGKSNHQIVCPDKTSSVDHHAVMELAEHLKKVTGCTFDIIPESSRDITVPCISVGRTELSKAVVSDDEYARLGMEGFVITSSGQDMFIVGGEPRGTLYGVFEFLEDLGVRWLARDATYVPKHNTLKLPEYKEYVPRLWYRDFIWNSDHDIQWRLRMRMNGQYSGIPKSLGGQWLVRGDCHSLPRIVHLNMYAQHPDWFALKPGKGRVRSPEFCLTNKGFREYVLNHIRSTLKKQPDTNQLWVGQADGFHDGCYCDKCTAERKKHGGSDKWSANVLGLLNYLAPIIKEEFPGVHLRTLAYSYSRIPPVNMKAASDNITVVVCGPGADWMDARHPTTTEFYDDIITGWTQAGVNVQMYTYGASNWNHWWPFPSYHFIGNNMNLAYSKGVNAIYMQGAHCQGALSLLKSSSGLAKLRAYLSVRMLWKPDRDVKAEMLEFCNLYYGPAGKEICDYLNWFCDYAKSNLTTSHHEWGSNDGWRKWCDKKVRDKGLETFKRALKKVEGDAVLTKRVEEAALPTYWLAARMNVLAKPKINDTEIVFTRDGSDRLGGEYEALFARIMKENGYKTLGEHQEVVDVDYPITNGLRGKSKVYTLKNSTEKIRIIPELGGRLVQWTSRTFGGEVFDLPRDIEFEYPSAGGYEEYSRHKRLSPGVTLKFKLQSQSDNSITLKAVVDGDMEIIRVIELDPQKPVVTVRSKYKNLSDKPQKFRPRSHVMLNPDHFLFGTIKVFQNGKWKRKGLCSGRKSGAENSFATPLLGGQGVYYVSQKTKASLFHQSGLASKETSFFGITNYSWAETARRLITSETWTAPKTLKPDQSSVFVNKFSIVR